MKTFNYSKKQTTVGEFKAFRDGTTVKISIPIPDGFHVLEKNGAVIIVPNGINDVADNIDDLFADKRMRAIIKIETSPANTAYDFDIDGDVPVDILILSDIMRRKELVKRYNLQAMQFVEMVTGNYYSFATCPEGGKIGASGGAGCFGRSGYFRVGQCLYYFLVMFLIETDTVDDPDELADTINESISKWMRKVRDCDDLQQEPLYIPSIKVVLALGMYGSESKGVSLKEEVYDAWNVPSGLADAIIITPNGGSASESKKTSDKDSVPKNKAKQSDSSGSGKTATPSRQDCNSGNEPYRIEQVGDGKRLVILSSKEPLKIFEILEKTSFDEIVISEGVKEIDERLCICNEHVKRVTISGSARIISEEAFAYCDSLESVTIEEGVSVIGKGAFTGCVRLRWVRLPSTLEVIEEEAFSDCDSLLVFWIPNSVRTIGQYAFNSDQKHRVYLPKSLEKYDKQWGNLPSFVEATSPAAGLNDTGLQNAFGWEKKIYFRNDGFESGFATSDGIIEGTIYYGNIKDYQNENHVIIPEKVETIGEYSFAYITESFGDEGFTVDFPCSLRTIKSAAFMGNDELRSVTFKEGIENICEAAFSGCPIDFVDLPETIEYIALDAFDKDTLVMVNGCYANAYLKEKQKIRAAHEKKAEIQKELDALEGQISDNRMHREAKERIANESREAIKQRENSIAEERRKNELIQNEYAHVQNEWEEKKKSLEQKETQLEQTKKVILEEIATLEKEHSDTFFLNFSKKSSLLKQIDEKKRNLQATENEFSEEEENNRKLKGQYVIQLMQIEEKKKNSQECIDKLLADNTQDESVIKVSEGGIRTLDLELDQLKENKKIKQKERDSIVVPPIDCDAIRVTEEAKLQTRKKILVRVLYDPETIEAKFPSFDTVYIQCKKTSRSIETELIEQSFSNYRTVTKWVEFDSGNSRYESNKPKFELIKELNRKLSLVETDGIEKYVCKYTEEFRVYCESRATSREWEKLRGAFRDYCVKELEHTPAMFLRDLPTTYYMILEEKENNKDFVIFPYGIVELEEIERNGHYIFRGIPFTDVLVQYIPVERETFTITKDDEIVSSRYEHQNKDGSPNSRYKVNRKLYLVREWSVRIGGAFEKEDEYVHYEVAHENQAIEIIAAFKEFFNYGDGK